MNPKELRTLFTSDGWKTFEDEKMDRYRQYVNEVSRSKIPFKIRLINGIMKVKTAMKSKWKV
jgi:hypothetical protein